VFGHIFVKVYAVIYAKINQHFFMKCFMHHNILLYIGLYLYMIATESEASPGYWWPSPFYTKRVKELTTCITIDLYNRTLLAQGH
jgi:hypothetical protein